jgi:tRNA (cmo5U34)-methyltransferase
VSDWTFAAPGLADEFDSYVREQLPFYDLATFAVADIVRLHLPAGGVVVDMGASTGNIGRAIAPVLEARGAHLIAVEPSAEMRAVYSGPGEVVDATAETFEIPCGTDIVVSFLTLAFVPPYARERILTAWQDRIRTGGTVVVVERVAAEAALTCRHLIHAAKIRAGVSEDDLLAKEVSIAGVLRPLPLDLIPSLGGCLFFAYGDFRGYVIEAADQ